MSQPLPDAASAAAEIAAVLNANHVEYAIGGALALGYWTDPRGTIDVDITLFLPLDAPHATVQILAEMGCHFSHRQIVDELREHGYCRVTYQGVTIDIFLPTLPLYEAAKDRRRQVLMGHTAVWVWEPEILCVFKMMFMRAQDFADIEKLIEAQAAMLDFDWVRQQLFDIFGQRDPRISSWDEIVTRTLRKNGTAQ